MIECLNWIDNHGYTAFWLFIGLWIIASGVRNIIGSLKGSK